MEQFRVVGLAVRREGLLLCAGLVAAAFGGQLMEDFSPPSRPLVVDPSDLGLLAVLVALVAPIGVWKGERLFGESPLWTVPVQHALHARLKIASGWVWLMAVIAFGYLVIIAAVLLAGGTVGGDETRMLATDVDAAEAGIAGSLTPTPWSTQLWQWTLPFTAATPVYLAASAFLIGLRRPVVWAAGCWLGVIALGEVAGSDRLGWVTSATDTVVYLFDLLGSGGTQSAQLYVPLAPGEGIRAWSRLPTMGSWAAATMMWLGLAGAAAWAASSRHREGAARGTE
jgi:hypothetical protein